MEIQNFGSVCQEIPSNKNGFFFTHDYYVLVYILDFFFFEKHTEGFQGLLEIPWKILEISNQSTLALICNSLEIRTLILALKFKVFQSQLHFPLEIFQLPSTLKTLEIFLTGHLDLERTLNFKVNFKEPWNSRLRLSSLVWIF